MKSLLAAVVVLASLVAASPGGPRAGDLNRMPSDVTAGSSKCTGVSAASSTTHWQQSVQCTKWTQASCWSGGAVPGPNDAASISGPGSLVTFPAGNQSSVEDYSIQSIKSLVIADGATVQMENQGLQVNQCLLVTGQGSELVLLGQGLENKGHTYPQANTYAEDPAQPEGTNCHLVPDGFTPRICGPGQLEVANKGNLTASGYYASLFIGVTLNGKNSSAELKNGSFMWGIVTVNDGALYTTEGYTYMHGFLYNMQGAKTVLHAIAFDKWADSFVESPPLMIQNHGDLEVHSSLFTTQVQYADRTHGVYKAALVNYGNVTFTNKPDQNWVGVRPPGTLGGTDFDLFNFGLIKWDVGTLGWVGTGNFVNRGIFLASGCTVYLSTYHSVNGVLEHSNDGSYSFGNGPVNPATVRLCTLQTAVAPVKPAARRAMTNQDFVQKKDGCWWYGDFCYHIPYIFTAPDVRGMSNQEASVGQKKNTNKIKVELSRLVAENVVPSPCSQRYTFSGEKSEIRGDGTGSLVSTLPLAVEDSLSIGKGGKWYALTESGNPPVWHGGTIRIRKTGHMTIGINADFNHDGRLVVEEGGELAIPKHARIVVSNHTINVKRGGIFHIDGQLSTHALSHRIISCGELRGSGKIVKSKDSDFEC